MQDEEGINHGIERKKTKKQELKNADDMLILANPHAVQILKNKKKYSCYTNLPFTRFMGISQKRYYERESEFFSVCFNYYRREFVEEVEFLTMSVKPDEQDVIFVIVGAAPGYDLEILIEFFPTIRFILYDPKPLKISKHENILEWHNTLFTDDDALLIKNKYQNKKILLQCYTRISHNKLNENLAAVLRWHLLMQPYRGSYEITLPYDSPEKKSPIASGTIYYPIWSKPAGSDCRLITEINTTDVVYFENKIHEECMMYFNTTMRTCLFVAEYARYEGVNADYDACYDCIAELTVLEKYAMKFHKKNQFQDIINRVRKYFQSIPKLPDWYVGNYTPH